jgi:GNAT superfamily N-acetyltransferase
MWFLISVKEFHDNGTAVNRQLFSDLVETEKDPVGLLAYENKVPIAWCSVGPRSRYARAIKTPTFKGRNPDEDDDVWFIPCFYVRKENRKQGVTKQLLESAIVLAEQKGATAIEAFPFVSGKRRSGGGVQVGFEHMFLECNFEIIRTPSTSRLVMRRELS